MGTLKPSRPIIRPPDHAPAPLFTVPIPTWLRSSSISTANERAMQADLRQAIEASLGCLFRLQYGVVTAADGRLLRLVVLPDAIEVYET